MTVNCERQYSRNNAQVLQQIKELKLKILREENCIIVAEHFDGAKLQVPYAAIASKLSGFQVVKNTEMQSTLTLVCLHFFPKTLTDIWQVSLHAIVDVRNWKP